jgi:hypothetical protein
MLVYITDYNGYTRMSGQDLGPEAGRYVCNHVGVSDNCKNFKNMESAFKNVSF